MKKILLLLLVITVIFIAIFLLSNFFYNRSNKPNAIIGNHLFNLEIAITDKQKAVGLAKYDSISQDFGMLFPFTKSGYYAFWMKNMKFPIDIIFIRSGKILKIFPNVPAPVYSNSALPIYRPGEQSDTVLEINAGLSQKYGFKNGDTVIINL